MRGVCVGIVVAIAGCVVPGMPGAEKPPKDEGVEDRWEASWAQSSGGDENGGVELVRSSGKYVPLRKDVAPPKITDRTAVVLFSQTKAAAYEWTWHTMPNEKYWGKAWCGGGLAFTPSWGTVDASSAKFLVLYAKTSHPAEEIDLKVGLVADVAEEARKKAGTVSLREHTATGTIGAEWTRAVIPLVEYAGAAFEWKRLQQVTFEPTGVYPENEKVWIRVNNVYLTDVEPGR